jgi:maleylacetoacetate isomerase
MTVLYDYWRSSAAYRIRIALAVLKLPHASIPVDLVKGEQRSPENLARNPQGLVPTLAIDGLVLTQSLAILEYLDETRAAGFLPHDAAGRARVRALAYAIAMETSPVSNLSVRSYAAEIAKGAITADDWQAHFIAKGLAGFEAMLDHHSVGRFCHGNTLSLADICLVPQVYNARRIGIDVTLWQRISTIMANLEAEPAVASAHPDKHQPKG